MQALQIFLVTDETLGSLGYAIRNLRVVFVIEKDLLR
jgi:hypothetical protein